MFLPHVIATGRPFEGACVANWLQSITLSKARLVSLRMYKDAAGHTLLFRFLHGTHAIAVMRPRLEPSLGVVVVGDGVLSDDCEDNCGGDGPTRIGLNICRCWYAGMSRPWLEEEEFLLTRSWWIEDVDGSRAATRLAMMRWRNSDRDGTVSTGSSTHFHVSTGVDSKQAMYWAPACAGSPQRCASRSQSIGRRTGTARTR